MKKLLNSLYITDEQAYLSLDGENVVCLLDKNEKFRIPFANVESIFCFSYIGCSPAFMGKCVEYKIPISFISPQGRFLAKVSGETKGNVHLRVAQLKKFEECGLDIAKNTIAAKISNTISLIKRSMHDNENLREDQLVLSCIDKLVISIANIFNTSTKEELMGIEGNAAKTYFNIFDNLIIANKNSFKFTSRTKRPPLDKVNAMLSFLYTIYTSDFAAALECVGLDSYIGYYHALRSGRCSLACDLLEETRHIIERLVLSMVNLKIVVENDFNKQVSGAVWLNEKGRKKVLTQWQEKKRSEFSHLYLGQKIQFGLIPFVQSNLLAKYVRGEIEEYPCLINKQR